MPAGDKWFKRREALHAMEDLPHINRQYNTNISPHMYNYKTTPELNWWRDQFL